MNIFSINKLHLLHHKGKLNDLSSPSSIPLFLIQCIICKIRFDGITSIVCLIPYASLRHCLLHPLCMRLTLSCEQCNGKKKRKGTLFRRNDNCIHRLETEEVTGCQRGHMKEDGEEIHIVYREWRS